MYICTYVYTYMYMCIYKVYMYMYVYLENGTNGKRQLPLDGCKRKTETGNGICFPWSAKHNR